MQVLTFNRSACSIAWLDDFRERNPWLCDPGDEVPHQRRQCSGSEVQRLRREQLPQINNSASSLSRGTSNETGRCRTNRIRRPLKLYMALGEAVSPARGLITLDVSLIRTQLTQHIQLVDWRNERITFCQFMGLFQFYCHPTAANWFSCFFLFVRVVPDDRCYVKLIIQN